MRILAIDTALGATSAGIFDLDSLECVASETLVMERGQAEALVPLVGRLISGVEGGFSSISRIAVTVGPGSFTGLRIGIAAARGFALACEVPVVGVSTLAAYAAPFVSLGENTIIAVAIDARHGEVYFQVFAPGGRTVVGARALSAREAARAIGSGPAQLVGSGAPILGIEAWNLGISARVVNSAAAPDIAWVARLGAAATPDGSMPRPLYLKGVNAAPQDAARVARR
jgi:tRNA threonylcarbamoyladenosine biosynthesis protein TsaB